MLALCTAVAKMRFEGIDTDLRMPLKSVLANRFKNSNWAYLLDPAAFEESPIGSRVNVPAMQFSSPAEQHSAVNKLMDSILGGLPGLQRDALAAIEWALSEITDNVLTHSESVCGGAVQLTNIRTKNRIEFAVSDAGLGIPKTLRAGHPEITSDTDALDRAIREGVTRDPNLGQGNGLFGTFQIARASSGYLHVHSGNARLDFQNDGVHIRTESIPCVGTLVVACIDRSNQDVLQDALRFRGEVHHPIDYVETQYESADAEEILFPLHEEASSFGSRIAGRPVRTKLQNLARMNPRAKIIVDMSGLPICSSSFADEVFGKLFAEIGPLEFMRRFEVRGASSTIRSLLDRAIMQRSASDA